MINCLMMCAFYRLSWSRSVATRSWWRQRRLCFTRRETSWRSCSSSASMRCAKTLREESQSLSLAMQISTQACTSNKSQSLTTAWRQLWRTTLSLERTRGKWSISSCQMRMYFSSCMRSYSQEPWPQKLCSASLILLEQLPIVSITLGSDLWPQDRNLTRCLRFQDSTRRTTDTSMAQWQRLRWRREAFKVPCRRLTKRVAWAPRLRGRPHMLA